MSQTLYRRRAILTRIHKALDAFYLLQRIDWEYDIRETLERIMRLALEEIEFDGGRIIERALIILQAADGRDLEVKAGWKVDEMDLSFSRTVVHETIARGEPILCTNAADDPRFMDAESIKGIETLSLVSVPISFDSRPIGALYVETKSAGKCFQAEDLEFLRDLAMETTPYLKTALTHREHVREIRKLKAEVLDRYSLGNIIGRSGAMHTVFDLIKIAADTDRTVLITGESGSGKELVARAIHYNGQRRGSKFVVVDCSSLAEQLLESELFGHKKGAFTGASHDKIGAFEEASGGTLFLDEISDASKALQQKLRRVLQEGEIRRVGDNVVRPIDVRVICATNRNLADLVKSGEFMRDLYFRINKFPISIPPLRERREDIPLLVPHFLETWARDGVARPRGLTSEAMEALVCRDWSENNIRELRNTVELAADLAQGSVIDLPLIERVLRIQEGAEGRRRSQEPGLGAAPAAAARSEPAALDGKGALVRVDTARFRSLLAAEEKSGGAARPERRHTPFYRLLLESSARAVVEGLRASQWKLRPAARILGISPMKLRGLLKDYLQTTLQECGGDVDTASSALEIPADVLRRKAKDLGISELLRGASP